MAATSTSQRAPRIVDEEDEEDIQAPETPGSSDNLTPGNESPLSEVDGLFGDESDKDERGPTAKKRARSVSDLDDDDMALDEEDIDDERVTKKQAIEGQKEVKLNIELPNYHPPAAYDGKVHHLQVPSHLHIDPHPYDSTKTPSTDPFHHPLSTLRYRNTPQGPRANARFLKWSDGSMSLQIGSEFHDIPQFDLHDPQFLSISLREEGVLKVLKRMDGLWKVSSAGVAAKRFVGGRGRAIGGAVLEMGAGRGRKVMELASTEDPEMEKKRAEKAEEEKIRSRKKLEMKRRQAAQRYGPMGGRIGGLTAEQLEMSDEEGEGAGVEKYNVDDFVVDDDEEEEARGGRLTRIKTRGAEKYKNNKKDESDEPEEDEDEDEDIDEDAEEEQGESEIPDDERAEEEDPGEIETQNTPKRGPKGRRIIVDDDDDDVE